ncbi:DUF397 domain-containing protein [Streptoalloteichus tenebrarius]|uniref:DUF397 domain-containing protein n=1 Tax=Streptoalloteichus tenebrarius (strain ATCC 17920 / DSM 40477 / JCM 4838 / CBS 697.72 / NBRC 16177 / NCIMB 11028 / NRRL B-12390 / A12253. 1 / ISP 5477) TaxID=1933 RepID=UPI0020A2E7AA|nr:DUF397 domain-containing protein [Streptoalloteichus tenebrarius]BFF01487.1 hypothetical protein GCM10020241_31620 [Streptoalloteichus tenebrarius]
MKNDVSESLWRKSSYSSQTTTCVEVAAAPQGAMVRDSKNPGGPVLVFGPTEFAAFTKAVKSGQFHLR